MNIKINPTTQKLLFSVGIFTTSLVFVLISAQTLANKTTIEKQVATSFFEEFEGLDKINQSIKITQELKLEAEKSPETLTPIEETPVVSYPLEEAAPLPIDEEESPSGTLYTSADIKKFLKLQDFPFQTFNAINLNGSDLISTNSQLTPIIKTLETSEPPEKIKKDVNNLTESLKEYSKIYTNYEDIFGYLYDVNELFNNYYDGVTNQETKTITYITLDELITRLEELLTPQEVKAYHDVLLTDLKALSQLEDKTTPVMEAEVVEETNTKSVVNYSLKSDTKNYPAYDFIEKSDRENLAKSLETIETSLDNIQIYKEKNLVN